MFGGLSKLNGRSVWSKVRGLADTRRLELGRDLYSQSGSPALGRIAEPSPSASARGVAAGRDPGRGPELGEETRGGAGMGRRRGGGCGGSCGPQAGARGPAWVPPEKQQCAGRGLVAMASKRAGPEERWVGTRRSRAWAWAVGGAWRRPDGAGPREEAGPLKGWGEIGAVL